jgi:hypothetical protein
MTNNILSLLIKKGKVGSIVAIIKGAKAENIIEIHKKIPLKQ